MAPSLEYVGVLSPFDLLGTSLKREVLFFDSIAIPNVQGDFILKAELAQCPIRSIEYLIDEGVVIDPVERYLGKETYLKKIGQELFNERLKEIQCRNSTLSDELRKIQLPPLPAEQSLLQLLSYPWGEAIKKGIFILEKDIGLPLQQFGASIALFLRQLDYDRRILACDLRDKHGMNAFPVYSQDLVLMDDFITGENDVIKVVLEKLPEPDFESTPWEQILDFRKNDETKKFLSYLRHWIAQAKREHVTFSELRAELDYLCNKYEEHIRVQKMKVNYGVFEMLLMITAEMLEGLIRIKPTQTVQALFSLKRQKVQLREAELKAPGRDLAYLIRAKRTFIK